jgi:thiamine kinase-like enzyme
MQLLQQTIANWREWNTGGALRAQPTVLRELVGGRTNRSFLVASGEFKAVVRINAVNGASLGIDRQREGLILELLQVTGAVPKVLFQNDNVLVSAFHEGRLWSDEDSRSAEQATALNQLLQRIQKVDVAQLQRRNYVQYCQAYIDQLGSAFAVEGLQQTILTAAAAIDAADWPAVICHHDLVPENILVTAHGLIVIDWEYAALGHPALDALRLYGTDQPSNCVYLGLNAERLDERLKPLAILLRGMDDLWSLVQSEFSEDLYEQGTQPAEGT